MFNKTSQEWKELDGLFTATEISQQPRLWRETVQILKENKNEIDEFLKKTFIDKDVNVIFTGAGTSAYVGDLVAPYLKMNAKGNFSSIPTTDIVSNPYMYLEKERPTLLVNFARSGNSPESVASVELANKLVDDIHHIFITCNENGKLAQIASESDNALLILMPKESNDKSFAMTSSFSCMSISSTLIFDRENLERNLEEIEKLSSKGEEIIKNGLETLKMPLDFDFSRIVYLGSGPYYAIAEEAALKLLELTRGKVVGYSESTMGFRHGPKSIINDETISFVYMSNNKYGQKYDYDIAREMFHDKGGHKVVVLGHEERQDITENSDLYINLDVNLRNDVFLGLLYMIYAQIFGLFSSIKHGINPDNPNPSGAVNRVVQGVIIYDYE